MKRARNAREKRIRAVVNERGQGAHYFSRVEKWRNGWRKEDMGASDRGDRRASDGYHTQKKVFPSSYRLRSARPGKTKQGETHPLVINLYSCADLIKGRECACKTHTTSQYGMDMKIQMKRGRIVSWPGRSAPVTLNKREQSACRGQDETPQRG